MQRISDYFHKKEAKLFFIACILVALLALFLRLYDIPARYSLDGDSVRDAVVAIGGAWTGQLPLTGPFSSTGPFTFGPWYYYQLILFAFLFHNPFAPWISMILVSLGFIPVMFAIGKELHNKWFGLLLATMATVTSTQLAIATSLSNINLIPLFSGLSIWVTIVLINRKKSSLWWNFLLGTSLGLGINYHYQMAGLLFLPIGVAIYTVYKKRFSWQQGGVLLLGIFLPCIPLLLFNLTNHWETVRGIIITAVYLKQSVYVANSWTIYLKSFWPELGAAALGIPVASAVILGVSAIIFYGWRIYKRQCSPADMILLITFAINFLLLRYYWGERHVVYFSYFHPFIYLFCGECLFFLWQKRYVSYPATLGFAIVLFFALKNDIPFLQPSGFYPEFTKEAAVIEKAFPNHKLLFYTCKAKINDIRARAATLLLSYAPQNKKSIRIGFMHDPEPCVSPVATASDNHQHIPSQLIVYPSVVGIDTIVNFSSASDAALLQAGWKELSVDGLYNETARWWFTEQP